MIRGINHLGMSVPDLDVALKFYRDLLGFEEVLSSPFDASKHESADMIAKAVEAADTAGKVATLRAGNLLLEIFQYENPTQPAQQPNRPVINYGYTHLCLDVTDVDFEYERLEKAGLGLRWHIPPTNTTPGIKTTYFRDPFGNVLELQEVLTKDHPYAQENLATKWEAA